MITGRLLAQSLYMMDLEPPNKKRRFFSDPDAQDGHPVSIAPPAYADPSSSPPVRPRFSQDIGENPPQSHEPPSSSHAASFSPAVRSPLSEKAIADASNHGPRPAAHHELGSSREQSSLAGFDQTTFEAFIGTKVETGILDVIKENCGDNTERAVNMYLDGTWRNFNKKTKAFAPLIQRPSPPPAYKIPPSTNPRSSTLSIRASMPDLRYVGAFGVEGWATRSGTNLLKHGDVVRIERTKIQAPSTVAKGQMKLGMSNAVRPNSAAARRVDNIVRFTATGGQELGRLSKETASWVSPLIDQGICKFEATCVYAPERLRTNDTVFLQLRCSLLKSAFFGRGLQLSDNRESGLFEETETSEEKDLRLRQVALVRLFQEINLLPTRTNSAAARQYRQGLLEAAEMAEKKEKQSLKPLNR